MLKEVKEILDSVMMWGQCYSSSRYGLADRPGALDDYAKQICQLFEPKHETVTGSVSGATGELKVLSDESRLLTRKDLQDKFPGAYQAIDGVWYYANEKSEYVPIPKQVKMQDAKTASIQEEHIAHLIDDVINLEKELKEKDAEWEHHVDHIIDNQKILERAKCQARVERIFKEIEEARISGKSTALVVPSGKWQALKDKYIKKQEGVDDESKG